MARGLSLALLALCCCTPCSIATLGCLDNDGNSVAWFSVYKMPQAYSQHRTKHAFPPHIYMDAHETSWSWSTASQTLDTPDQCVGRTLNQVYNDPQNIGYFMYNDEKPDVAGGSVSVEYGHAKGVFAVDGSGSAFWLIHSVPKYPPSADVGTYSYPQNAVVYGQHFLCVTLGLADVDRVGTQAAVGEEENGGRQPPWRLRMSAMSSWRMSGRVGSALIWSKFSFTRCCCCKTPQDIFSARRRGRPVQAVERAEAFFEAISKGWLSFFEGYQLRLSKVLVYSSNWPAQLQELSDNLTQLQLHKPLPDGTATSSVLPLSTPPPAFAFVSFSKSAKFGKDLYDSLVATPGLNSSLRTETWSHGREGINLNSTCNTAYKVENIKKIQSDSLSILFNSTDDHSKLAISAGDAQYVCIGDINRQTTQLKRGGGTVCFHSPDAWTHYNDLVAQVDECPARPEADQESRKAEEL